MVGLLVGAAAVAAVTWIRLALTPLAGADMALIFYILAVLCAAAIGGAPAGVATTLMSLWTGVVLIIGPRAIAGSLLEWIRVTIFTVEGVAISLAVDLLQRRTESLRQTARALDAERQLVERLALEDAMTGLGNRRAFEGALAQSLAQSSRQGTPLTVAIADVDGLKQTNDEQGHARGDALLIAVAGALRGCCRASDTAYRVGGDEFALLLLEADREDYAALESRLRDLLKEVSAGFPGTGVSIGAAHAPEDGDQGRILLRLADARMYEKKARSHTGTTHRATDQPDNASHGR